MLDRIAAPAEAAIVASIERGEVPGASLVVVDGDDRLEIVRGAADPLGTPLTVNTVGRYFSSVKPVTSVVVLQLIDDGLFRLDTPICDLLPEWVDRNPSDGMPSVHHLLTHTAGLSYEAWETGPDVHPVDAAYRDAGIDFLGYLSLEEFSTRLAAQPLCFSPGERWRYSVAHDLLGRVIEAATGQSVSEVFEQRLFGPLAMTSSGFYATAALVDRLGACWLHRPGEEPELELSDPAGSDSMCTDFARMASCGGGLLSTLDDYVTFLLMLRNDGVHDGRQIVSSASVDAMMSDQLAPHIVNEQPDVGWTVGTTSGFGYGGEVARDGSNRFSWGGYAGTNFFVDRQANRVAALHIQVQNDFTVRLWRNLIPNLVDPPRSGR